MATSALVGLIDYKRPAATEEEEEEEENGATETIGGLRSRKE